MKDKSQKRAIIALLISFLTTVSLFLIGYFLNIGYDIVTFLYIGKGKFDDFINGVVQAHAYFSPELLNIEGFGQVASPITIAYYGLFQPFVYSMSRVYLVLALLFIIYAFILFKILESYKVTALLLISYPILYLFGRGNPDILAGIVLATICLKFALENKKNRVKSELDVSKSTLILFGILGAIKFPYLLFGIVFVILPILNRKMEQALRRSVIFFGSCILAFVLPLLFKPWPVVTQVKVFKGIVDQYNFDYVIGDAGLLHNSSLFGTLKFIFYFYSERNILNVQEARQLSGEILSVYYILIFVLILSLLISFLPKIKGRFEWKFSSELLLFAAGFIIITAPVSADYRLALFIPPLALMIREGNQFLTFQNWSFLILLFSPKHFFHKVFDFHEPGVTLNTLLNGPIIILLLVRISLHYYKGLSPKATRKP